jgi:MYXO-CTERM domain-containing protein
MLPGACAAANGDTAANIMMLATGVVGLGALTLLSERWRLSHLPPLQMERSLSSNNDRRTPLVTADGERSG